MQYTEYSQDRVNELMKLSKKEFTDIPDNFVFLMCVDYHCRDEVKMDVPENEELKKMYNY
jgi:hypothetical protein